MEIKIEIPDAVVVSECPDTKGNPVAVLSVLGVPVLYARPETLDRCGGSGGWEDVFRAQLGHILADRFLEALGSNSGWGADSPTGRDVRTGGPECYC